MTDKGKDQELEELRARLTEAQETIDAIRKGEIDALVVEGDAGAQVYTLKGADHPYQVLIEAMSEGALTLSEDGLILYSNSYFAEMLGSKLEAILGQPFAAFLSPENSKDFIAFFEQGLQEYARIETSIKRSDGKFIPIQLAIGPYPGEGFTGACMVVTDLSMQKRNEEILAAERMASSIIDQAGDAIVVCDANGLIIRASKLANQLAGQNTLFRAFDKIFKLKFDAPNYYGSRQFILRALAGEMLRNANAQLEKASVDANEVPKTSLVVNASPLRNQVDEILGCVVTMSDITYHKKLEAELGDARDRLEERITERTRQLSEANKKLNEEIIERRDTEQALKESEAKLRLALLDEKNMQAQLVRAEKHSAMARMVASIAHELNNPIQTIQNCVFLIESQSGLNDTSKEALSMAMSESGRISNLVSQLREFFRAPAEGSRQLYNLNDVVNQVYSLIYPHLQHHRVNWHYNIQTNCEPVLFNLDQLKQVFLNISINAIEAMDPDGGTIYVELYYPDETGQVCVSFRDTGPGISAEIQQYIFEPFYTTKDKGTGLGLSICQEIISNHQGKITVDSQPGQGAKFTIWLPIGNKPV